MSLASAYVQRFARPPSTSTVERAISTHESVRALLGDAEYMTFLQGSYKNDTALWDMNDVDIVAVAKGLTSCHFTGIAASPGRSVAWDEIFSRIERKLQSDGRYQGKWKREDKCIRLNTGVKIDIVPAVRIAEVESDPISIYSFASRNERRNWPRAHFEAGVAKSKRTDGAYKQSVRFFKRLARCWFGSRKVAPSYYLECATFAQPDELFSGDLERDFVSLGTRLAYTSHSSTLPRLAGEGNLFSETEWDHARFLEFQLKLRQVLAYASAAQLADSEERARDIWTAAFNGQGPG